MCDVRHNSRDRQEYEGEMLHSQEDTQKPFSQVDIIKHDLMH